MSNLPKATSGTVSATFQQEQANNNSASCSVNHQSVALSWVSHVLRAPLTGCQSCYYQREQAADPAGSRRAAIAPSTGQRKSLSGKQLMSLTLTKVIRVNPDPSLPLRPSVCHHVPPPPRPTSWLCSPAVWPPLMTQSSCQRSASRQAERGRPFDEDPDTLQHRRHAGGLWTSSRPCTPALALEHVLSGRTGQGTVKRSASFENVPRSLMVLMKAFEFFHPALETS